MYKRVYHMYGYCVAVVSSIMPYSYSTNAWVERLCLEIKAQPFYGLVKIPCWIISHLKFFPRTQDLLYEV